MVIDTVLKHHGPKFDTVMSSFPGSLLTSGSPGFPIVFLPIELFPTDLEKRSLFWNLGHQKCKMLGNKTADEENNWSALAFI